MTKPIEIYPADECLERSQKVRNKMSKRDIDTWCNSRAAYDCGHIDSVEMDKIKSAILTKNEADA